MNGTEQATQQKNATADSVWLATIGALTVYFVVWIFSFWPSVNSMIAIWNRSDTFAHGYLILPIAIWLVWYRRRELAAMQPKPALLPLIVAGGAIATWILAKLTGVLVVEQIAAITTLCTVVWALLGHRVATFLSFPILYLYLAVPMGEDLVPPMMDFTAYFTVRMLQLSDIPVFREGLHFVIPSGRWSVVEACSGVRYIIASVTLGVLYAYITYNSLWRRLAFIALSALVPIIANGLRAYMIVMLGHLSGNKIAVGVDHLIYGWVFFGLVMVLLFWIGSFWAEPPPESNDDAMTVAGGSRTPGRYLPAGLLVTLGLAIAGTFVAPIALEARLAQAPATFEVGQLPARVGDWNAEAPDFGWVPRIQGETSRLHVAYRNGSALVEAFFGVYPRQTQGSEAVSSINLPVDEDAGWLVKGRRTTGVEQGGQVFDVNTLRARTRGAADAAATARDLTVWQWYRVGNRNTGNKYRAKIHEAVNVLFERRTDVVFVAIAADDEAGGGGAALERFMREVYPALEQLIETARRTADR